MIPKSTSNKYKYISLLQKQTNHSPVRPLTTDTHFELFNILAVVVAVISAQAIVEPGDSCSRDGSYACSNSGDIPIGSQGLYILDASCGPTEACADVVGGRFAFRGELHIHSVLRGVAQSNDYEGWIPSTTKLALYIPRTSDKSPQVSIITLNRIQPRLPSQVRHINPDPSRTLSM
jgi:hypothetical protein